MSRILVIDDEEDVRALALEALASAGHEVILAADGVQGLKLQRERPADVVITDLLMPEKEGIETILDLKREFPNVKIIAISGGGKAVNKLSYLSLAGDLGADLVLTKPFDIQFLLKAVQEVTAAGG